MSELWNKVDAGLATLYANWRRVREQGVEPIAGVRAIIESGDRITVSLQAKIDPAELEGFGYRLSHREDELRSTGSVHLPDLERLTEHPDVLRVAAGLPGQPFLDESVPDIRANLVWTLTAGTFTGQTGAGALVGVFDTGIDFRHPFFLGSTSPPTTRILRIWDPGLVPTAGDPGLVPTAGESSPDVALLDSAATYGVEYTDKHINDVLREVPGARVRHRDCGGHGTHVASIAAGDGGAAHKFVGVAPRADLIVVKFFDLETGPIAGGSAVSRLQLFKDAVTYIRKVADALHRPVAINCSFGSNIGPHDGYTDEEDWLTKTFAAPDYGKVFIQAAGNDGHHWQHARIAFPAGGASAKIPLSLIDNRTNRREPRSVLDYGKCQWLPATEPLHVDIYYPDGPATLSVDVDIPGDGKGFGPALGESKSKTFGRFTLDMLHKADRITLHTGDVVNRNEFKITCTPVGDRFRHGQYMLKLTASDAMAVHLWCQQVGVAYGFIVDDAVPAIVHVEDLNLIGSTGGARNTLTVACYDAENDDKPIFENSSRGPLVSWGGPPQPDKPDVAAPGLGIDAAQSRFVVPKLPGDTVPMNGTSMSAPHVTGLVALMLAKRPTLAGPVARSIVRAHARTVPATTPPEAGMGRVDAKNAVDSTPP
jgi:subtilisin family serine protease